MSAQKLTVNLLPPSEFEQSFWGRFLKWAVTTGRYIIIVTEMVVILAFLSRFKLDEELRNVNEQIQTQVSYLESENDRLEGFLAVQNKIGLLDKAMRSSSNTTDVLKYIDSKKPPEISISVLTVSKNKLTMTANTLSEAALGKMMISMSQDGIWKSLDLTEIVSDPSVGIKFTLTAKK